jgi:hypothetical protein
MRITSIRVQNKILQTQIVRGSNIVRYRNLEVRIHYQGNSHVPQKHLQVRKLVETALNGLVFIPGREKAILAATKVELIIYNRWEINPEYEKVLS